MDIDNDFNDFDYSNFNRLFITGLNDCFINNENLQLGNRLMFLDDDILRMIIRFTVQHFASFHGTYCYSDDNLDFHIQTAKCENMITNLGLCCRKFYFLSNNYPARLFQGSAPAKYVPQFGWTYLARSKFPSPNLNDIVYDVNSYLTKSMRFNLKEGRSKRDWVLLKMAFGAVNRIMHPDDPVLYKPCFCNNEDCNNSYIRSPALGATTEYFANLFDVAELEFRNLYYVSFHINSGIELNLMLSDYDVCFYCNKRINFCCNTFSDHIFKNPNVLIDLCDDCMNESLRGSHSESVD